MAKLDPNKRGNKATEKMPRGEVIQGVALARGNYHDEGRDNYAPLMAAKLNKHPRANAAEQMMKKGR